IATAEIGDAQVTPEKLSFVPGGGAVRPLVPPVATAEIADGAVTKEKLATDSVTQTKIARDSVGWSEIRAQSLEPEQIKTLSGEPPLPGQVPVYDEAAELDPLNPTYWWFKWATPGVGVSRPITPPVAKEELKYKIISIIIPALQVGGLYPPLGDPDLNGGVILGYSIPTNQDQLIRQLFLLPGLPQGTGISILLNQPAIADNTFEVVVLRG
ncbi:MAG: hypothetical protein V1871_04055, partial [Planctomycetota bacterium]